MAFTPGNIDLGRNRSASKLTLGADGSMVEAALPVTNRAVDLVAALDLQPDVSYVVEVVNGSIEMFWGAAPPGDIESFSGRPLNSNDENPTREVSYSDSGSKLWIWARNTPARLVVTEA
ncbi:MAG: hypothetical protein OXE53_13120 [Deltaproteobacteria bacterium]|nr:hypothetical protein [Deltaproteobacteria bacterium]